MAEKSTVKSISIIDLFEETFFAVTANKTRSGLTMLGIVIGIASVISLVAIGAGAQSSVESSIQSLGSNLLTISPGAQTTIGSLVRGNSSDSETLTESDAEVVSKISGVKAVSEESTTRAQIIAGVNNTNTNVIGSQTTYMEVHNLTVAEGSWFSDTQLENYEKVAVIGPGVRDDLFGEDATDSVGQTINIAGIPFTVVGVTTSKGGTGFNNTDNYIYIPLTTAQQYLTGSKYLGSISVEAESQDVMTSLENTITATLMVQHGITDSADLDFSVVNQSDIVSTASSVTSVLTELLAAVASISLVVGGIGIMNMMLTTVTERTREIGLRKAIGAQNGEISLQFLAESVVLTFMGGFIGIVLGWAISWGLAYFSISTTKVSVTSILLAFGVSAGIGIIFGYYPAKRASKLNPIEALRYE